MDRPIQFGKYLLLERIGIGGMAEVFRASLAGAAGFERIVAIKRILPHLVEDDDFVKMFIDEAKIAVQLNHPNITQVQDLGRAEGTLYIAMEYVFGKDLRALYELEKERDTITPIGLGCHVVMKMCEALHHAHFATGPTGQPLQVIHRDVSPQNVLLSYDGEVKVVDFGLAKAKGRMVQTQAGVVKGKLAYMSPEQLTGEEIDHRVDIFGLGIVLFELLTGTRLFLGPSDMDTLKRVYAAEVPDLQERNPGIDADLEAIVRRALAKDRETRFQTALELHEALQTYVYASGHYLGASALREYLRVAFPQGAPEEDMPPFVQPVTPSPPPPPPTATIPPPYRAGRAAAPRPEAASGRAGSPQPTPPPQGTVPYASGQAHDPFDGEMSTTPVLADDDVLAPLTPSPPRPAAGSGDDDVYEPVTGDYDIGPLEASHDTDVPVDLPLDVSTLDGDLEDILGEDVPTERPQAPAHGLEPMYENIRSPGSLPPASLPSHPPGLGSGPVQVQIPPAAPAPVQESAVYTTTPRPAAADPPAAALPAGPPPFETSEWGEEDEPTLFTALPEPEGGEDWGEEATVVVASDGKPPRK